MSSRRQKVALASVDVGTVVDKLMAHERPGFTCAQLTAAVSRCRALCPGIEISHLHPLGSGQRESTNFVGSVPSEQAHVLMDVAQLPKPPKRCNADPASPFWRIERRAGGLIHFGASFGDDVQIAGLTHLGPSAIRLAVPEAPESERAWRGIVARHLCAVMRFSDQEMVETILRRPVRPSSMPAAWQAREAAYVAANGRFYLRQEDIERLVVLYARRQSELQRELLAAIDATRVCGPGTVDRMSLVVDNTRPQVRS